MCLIIKYKFLKKFLSDKFIELLIYQVSLNLIPTKTIIQSRLSFNWILIYQYFTVSLLKLVTQFLKVQQNKMGDDKW